MNIKAQNFVRVLTVASGLGLATAAHAQQAVMSRYDTPAAGDAFFAVYGANVDGHLAPRGQLTFDFSHRSFVLTDEAGKELASPSAERLLAHASVSFAIANRFLFSVDAPFALAQTGDTVALSATRELAPTEGAAVGELRVGLRARLFGHATDPFQLALAGLVYLPTATDAWGGEGYVHAQPTLQVGGRFKSLRYGAHVGTHVRRSEDPTSLTYAAGLGLSLMNGALFIGPEFHGGVDLIQGKVLDGELDLSSGPAAEVLLGAQARF